MNKIELITEISIAKDMFLCALEKVKNIPLSKDEKNSISKEINCVLSSSLILDSDMHSK